MKFKSVKGTRDFYPQEMAVHNFIIDGWKKISVKNGFEEYDGPIFELLQMYKIKSGEEIVEQLFSLTDRGGRELAIRPEITPTLARMVNKKINSLPKPIKWFSVPRLCRAERPQKGRLREFYQWNIDIIGVDDVRADAEIVYTTVDYLKELGLKSEDIKAKISSRKLLANLLLQIGIEEEKLEELYPLLDKKAKIPADAFEETLKEYILDPDKVGKIIKLMEVSDPEQIANIVSLNEEASESLGEIKDLFHYLDLMDISEFCEFDMGIVRGLAYYTGIVFEIHDIKGELRAICGGGRYDELLKQFGGPKVTGTGMGMGDCVLEILLREKGLIKESIIQRSLDYYLVCADDNFSDQMVKLAAKIREKGLSADFSYKSSGLGKQLKAASQANSKKAIIIGREFKKNKLTIKDMDTGEQKEKDIDEFYDEI